jgi:hypothetical protein
MAEALPYLKAKVRPALMIKADMVIAGMILQKNRRVSMGEQYSTITGIRQ